MCAVPKSLLGSLLRGLAWVCFGAAGLSFWWGGRAISEFGHEDRFLAEFEGIGFAAVCTGLGFVAKGAGSASWTPTMRQSTPPRNKPTRVTLARLL
jgi:hypothetical protein